MRNKGLVVLLVLCFCWCGWAQPVPEQWAKWAPLLGEWTGEGGGQPGQATAGVSTFRLDLQGKVIVRTNFAEYAATKDKPAFRHDDLMIIYRDDRTNQLRAEYLDSEGHIIRYLASEKDGEYTFVSEAADGQPRYRLIYTKPHDGTLTITFEIAPPGTPNAFRTYLRANARKR